MRIEKSDFDRTIDDFMGDVQSARARFLDAEVGDSYTIRLERQGGILRDCIDCIPKLNGRDAWQVHRSQSKYMTVGGLLLKIASAPPGISAQEFFA